MASHALDDACALFGIEANERYGERHEIIERLPVGVEKGLRGGSVVECGLDEGVEVLDDPTTR